MTSPKLRAFVSSKMEELSEERRAVRAALNELRIDGWIFENDAGARPQTIQQVYLHEVEAADLYIGLFWKGYGNYTIEEYEFAQKSGKDCLIYEKRTEIDNQRDPQLRDFLERIGKVETGHAVRWFNTPDELERYVKEDVARWQTEIIRRHKVSGAPIAYQGPAPPDDRARQELSILASKVKHFWIHGVLERSLHDQVLIELRKTKMAGAVEHPWETVLELPDDVSSSTPTNKHITDVFEEVDHFLLILGEPGSGKTTTLLELARDLIIQSEKNPGCSLPTVFNLSSWADKEQPLGDWLIEELKSKYQIPKKISQTWLEQHRILPLLDGLDEVRPDKQVACVNAINRFIAEYPAGVVVCSRLQEYTSLPIRLKLNGAICLQSLSLEQTDEYLNKAGADLSALRQVLKTDQNLQDIVKTPLMLSIMSLAYQNQSVAALSSTNSDTIESRRSQVFDRYIERMFQRKGKQNQSYAKDKVNLWLRWLAQRMQAHSQSIFIIEQLQPAWLLTLKERFLYLFLSRLMGGLLLGVCVGIPIGVLTYITARDIRLAVFTWLCSSLAGLILGAITCCVELIRMVLNEKFKAVAVSTNVVNVAIYAIPWLLIFELLLLIASQQSDQSSLLLGVAGALLWFPVILLAAITHSFIFCTHYREPYWSSDITTVETLRWSWPGAVKSAVRWAGLTFFIVLPISMLTSAAQMKMDQASRERYELLASKLEARLAAVENELRSMTNSDEQRRVKLENEKAYLLARIDEYKKTAASRPAKTSGEAVTILLMSLGFSLGGGLLGILFEGFRGSVLDRKTIPNQGIRLTIRNSAFTGMTVALFFMVTTAAVGLYFGYIPGIGFKLWTHYGLPTVLVVGTVAGLIAAFRGGGFDVIKHYSLRVILSYKGYIPRNLVGVLNYATMLILLQNVGGGYIFIHRLLLEHFAAMENKVRGARATS